MPSSKKQRGTSYTEQVAARLRSAREQMGLNQTDFAELGGVKRSSQILYEGVDRYPDTLYFQTLQENHLDTDSILCTTRAIGPIDLAPIVLQRIFMASAGIKNPNDPRVELFQNLCAACVGRSDPTDVDRFVDTLSQFRRTAG